MKCAAPIALCLLLCACRETGKEEHRHGGEQHPPGASHGHEDEEGGPGGGQVRIDPSMLRDLRITTAPVEVRPAGEAVTALGEIAVNEDRYVEISTPVAAQVTRVMATAGEVVKQGQPLAELHSAELGKARAALGAAEARVAVGRKTIERKRALEVEGVVASREVQEAEADLAAAEAEAAAARAQLSAVGLASSDGAARFLVKSPIAGTVIERSAVVGRSAEPSRPLFHVGDLSRLWLVVHGFERDAVRVRAGAQAQVTLAAVPGRSLKARVAFIGARVDPVSRTIPIRLELDNPDGLLRPGMSATAFIPLGEQGASVATVPVVALQRLEDGWYVFLPGAEEGAFERRAVGRGRTLGGEVEILSGLGPTDRVVVEGAFLLKAELEKARGAGGRHEH